MSIRYLKVQFFRGPHIQCYCINADMCFVPPVIACYFDQIDGTRVEEKFLDKIMCWLNTYTSAGVIKNMWGHDMGKLDDGYVTKIWSVDLA
jgi:hypothetical protein